MTYWKDLVATVTLLLMVAAGAGCGDRAEVHRPPDWQALRKQYPEIFEVAAGFDCGQSVADLKAHAQQVGNVEINTANTVGSEMSLSQGPVRFWIGGRESFVIGPSLVDAKLPTHRRYLCPLLSLGPEYVGATVLVDGAATATVTARRTPLKIPRSRREIRIRKVGLPDIVVAVLDSRAHEVFLEIGA